MTTIVGLDMSLTSTGIATVATDGVRWTVDTRAVFSSASGHAGLAERADRIRNIGFDVTIATDNADLVLIEGPSFGSKGAGTWDRAWLWGHIVNRVTREGKPLVEIPPTVRAKFATGKGNAGKTAVAMAAAKMWPDWEPTFKRAAEDEADSLVIASIGCVLDGLNPPFQMTDYRHEVIAKIQLPQEAA